MQGLRLERTVRTLKTTILRHEVVSGPSSQALHRGLFPVSLFSVIAPSRV